MELPTYGELSGGAVTKEACDGCGQVGLSHWYGDLKCMEQQVKDLRAALTASWVLMEHEQDCKVCSDKRADVDADYSWHCDFARQLDHDWWGKRYDALGIPKPKYWAD